MFFKIVHYNELVNFGLPLIILVLGEFEDNVSEFISPILFLAEYCFPSGLNSRLIEFDLGGLLSFAP